MSSTITDGVTTATPDLVLEYAYERTARTIVHDVLDRSDPDITLRPVGLRAGTLALFCADRATASAVEELHRRPVPLTLDASADEPTASMAYVTTGTVAVAWDAEQDRWTVRAGFQEVSP